MEKLAKQFTRDVSLAICQWWRTSQNENFKRKIGAGYSDFLAVSNGLSCTFYCLESDVEALKEALFSRMKEDEEYFFRESDRFRNETEQTRILLDMLEKEGQLDLKTLGILRTRFDLLYPMYRFALVLPAAWRADLDRNMGPAAEKIADCAYEDRKQVEGMFERFDAVLRKLVGKKIGKSKVPILRAKFLTEKEVGAIACDESLDWKEVEKRTGGFVYSKGIVHLTQNYASAFKNDGYSIEEEKVGGEKLKGQSAFSGKTITGKVRKLYAIEQAVLFRPGEILVMPMTIPEFLPIMKKAAAIVTDEGGITCHAAIVSRELKIPCVIGTRVATRLLNDGDVVEVDSASGVVRKVG
ncbi:MAG TPA: PEP-utilizing enzyme [Candidatus Norongarragalinales archaeon]|nr:PEP-utilizing enzyme [Candidatus Norongarragalinales archaeon]